MSSAVSLAVGGEEPGQTGAAQPVQEAPKVLGRLGNYELLDRIASGGMGVVYKARQIGLDRIVALKVLPFGPFTREEFVKRFQIEASAAAKLRHPSIVTIFEVGKADGYSFFSMEFVEGTTLAELVREQPLPMERAVRLVRTVAEAVHYAHQQGILHRDLKPSNVLVDVLDQPHVTDFGLAKQLNTDSLITDHSGPHAGSNQSSVASHQWSDLTITGQPLGSPNFIPPEQAEGRHNEGGPRSDVYGLGAILYYLITGRPPFSADSATTVLQQVVQIDPPAPRVLNPAISRDLETICLKCLEKEPARRYATAQEVADELGRFQRREPIVARPIGPVARTWRWFRRRPAIAALLAAVFFVFAAGFGATFGQWRRAEQAAERLAENVTRLEIDRAEDRLQRGETSEGLAQLANVLRREPQNPVAATRILAVLSQRRFILPTDTVIQDDFVGRNSGFTQHGHWFVTATNRGATLQLWDTRDGLRLAGLTPCGEPVRVASFRGDGQQVVAATANGGVLVFDVPSRSRREEAQTPSADESQNEVSASLHQLLQSSSSGPHKIGGYIDRVVLSPDGAQVIAHVSGPNSDDWKRAKLIVVESASGRVLREETNMHWAAFSPDGKWLVTVSDRTAQFRNPSTWEPIGPPRRHGARINTAAFSPDTRLLVTASADSTARLWHVDTGECAGAVMRHDLQVLSAVFSPDGQRVLTKDLSRHGQLWNGTNGSPVGQPFDQARVIAADSFSADGALVVTFSESEVCIRDAATGALIAEPLDTGQVVPRARFIGSGRQVLTSTFGGVAQIWSVPTRMTADKRFSHRAEVNGIALSPDASMIAVGTKGNSVPVWDVTTGESVASLPHQSQVLQVSCDPIGGRVVTASTDATARVWELPSGRPLGEPLRHQAAVFDAAFSPDGRWLVTCSEDRTARLWNADTLQPASAPLRHNGDVRTAAFRADGKILATAGFDRTVRLWSVPEGKAHGEPLRHSNTLACVVFSPNGNVLASCGSEKGARLWNTFGVTASAGPDRLNEQLRTFLFLPHEAHVNSVQFDRAGSRVVTASDDRTARIWSVSTGAALARPLRHADEVVWADFSPDGRFVLTASSDGTAHIWDSATGHPLSDPLRHDGIVTSARWSPHGDFVVTGSYDRTVRIWPLDFLLRKNAPTWLPDLAEAVGGKRLVSDHLHEPVQPAEFLRLREALLNRPQPESHRRWLEAFFARAQTNTFAG